MSEYDYECAGFADGGVWVGCDCPDCNEAEDDAIEHDVEARGLHALNDAARGE